MNMASIGIFIFILIITAGNASFVNVQCKTENVGQYGHQSLLECTVETKEGVTDVVIRSVSWKKEGVDDPLLVFHNEEISTQQPGYSFAEPSWNNKNMNVSLHITDTAVEDQGDYTCSVLTDRGAKTSKTSLKVTAKYSKPTIISEPEKISRSTGGTLVCNSDGGYPEGEIRWFGELNEEWTKSAKMEVETKSGLFELSSKLTLLQGSTYSKYTCAVFNSSGGKEDEATFQVPDGQDASGRSGEEPGKPPGEVTTIVAPLLVIGSVIVGLLVVVVILHKRRSRRDHREARAFESDAEEGGSQEVDKDYHDTLA